MWNAFLLSVIVGALVLYLPGFVLFRSLRISSLLALACAPIYGVFMCATLPIAYYELGVPCNTATILGPIVALAALVGIISRAFSKKDERISFTEQKAISLGPLSIPFDILVPLLYVAVACIVCAVIFIRNLPTPDAFACRYDNQVHLNYIRAFLDSGKWSSLHSNSFLASTDNARPTHGTGSFYPCAWHCVTALICGITKVSVPAGINALLVVNSCLIFPLAEYAFLRALFPKDRYAVILGALVASGFSNWPWHFVVMGPLYPNILGLSLMFAILALVVTTVDGKQLGAAPFGFVLICAISFVAIALSHPNTVFSMYIFMAFYGATVIDGAIAESKRLHGVGRIIARIVAVGVYACAVVGFWVLCYHVPQLADVINYGSNEHTGFLHVLASILSLRFSFTKVQAGMCIACLFGCIALVRRKDRWRLLLPALFFTVAYLATRCGWKTVQYWTAGLWYSDRRRLAINITLFLMPVAALGLSSIYTLAFLKGAQPVEADEEPGKGRHFAAHAAQPARLTTAAPTYAGALAVALIVAITCLPTFTIPVGDGITVKTCFGMTNSKLEERYEESEEHVYGPEEIAFVEKVVETIPDGALVINSPADGSLWAYGANGLNTFYRSINTGGQPDETVLIRKHLNDYAKDDDVHNAVDYTGAQYVLLLDKDVPFDEGHWLGQYSKKRSQQWSGIDAINDDTPGFEVVLSEGDELRLYKIEE